MVASRTPFAEIREQYEPGWAIRGDAQQSDTHEERVPDAPRSVVARLAFPTG
jgi:hypothetical protein